MIPSCLYRRTEVIRTAALKPGYTKAVQHRHTASSNLGFRGCAGISTLCRQFILMPYYNAALQKVDSDVEISIPECTASLRQANQGSLIESLAKARCLRIVVRECHGGATVPSTNCRYLISEWRSGLLKTWPVNGDQPRHIDFAAESSNSHPVRQIGMFLIRTLGT